MLARPPLHPLFNHRCTSSRFRGAYSNDGLWRQLGNNEEAREMNRLESIVRMHKLTWKRGIAQQQQNKDASKVFGGDRHD